MVKYTDIRRSIVRRIKTIYPNVVFSKDIEKAITRPSFFIDFDNIKASDFMREAQDRSITVRIYYFSSTIDSNNIELLNIQDSLIEMFLENNLITVNEDIKFEIDDLDLNVIDKVLHCYFDVKISENYPRDKSSISIGKDEGIDNGAVEKEMMENLELNKLEDLKE